MADEIKHLWQYPFVLVRVSCNLCSRRGRYRLAHLAERYGASATIEHVLDQLAGRRCPYRRPWQVRKPRKYVPYCHIDLPDLHRGPPPELPPGEGIRLVVANDPDKAA